MLERRAPVLVLVVVLVGLGVCLGDALADRAVTAPPLSYSGVIFDASGGPIADSDSNTVALSLYDGPDAATDTLLCPTVSSSSVASHSGHFSLPLSAACSDVFLSAPEAWAHATINGTTIAPTRIGAVPYAVTAERVVYGGANGVSEGLFCGYSASGTNAAFSAPGGLTGYAAARALCQTACGSPTAHICELAELVRSSSLGPMEVPPDTGTAGMNGIAWYSADPGTDGSGSPDSCRGFTSGGSYYGAGIWVVESSGSIGYPQRANCDYPNAHIACCD